jgi:hypothetical protein
MPAPLLDQHFRLRHRVEYLAVKQLVPELAPLNDSLEPFFQGDPGSM